MLLLITKSLTRPVLSFWMSLKRNNCKVNWEKGWDDEFPNATLLTIRMSRDAKFLM